MTGRDRAVCLFDGDCAFCRRWAARLDAMSAGAVEVSPWQAMDLGLLGVTAQQCTEALQFVDVDGTVSSGADAVAATLRRSRRPWRVAGLVLAAPGVIHVARPVYGWVARNRHRLTRRSRR